MIVILESQFFLEFSIVQIEGMMRDIPVPEGVSCKIAGIVFVAAVYYKNHNLFPSFVTNSTIQLLIRFVKFDSCAIVVE